MAELTTRGREHINKGNFAYVDRQGEGHLPIHDESHIRNAMARWNQTDFESATAKESARRKIVAAAMKHGIEVSVDDKVTKPVRGGRKGG
ncbi:MAG: DUF6582 domain-containing protein [Mycobacterium sp.]